MDIYAATTIFDALAQETRLRALQQLVRAGSGGLAAGALVDRLGVPQNTLSFHLAQLSRAGVVTSRKEGRSVIYSANFPAIVDLVSYLVKDCCSEDVAQLHPDETDGATHITLNACCASNTD